MAEILLDARGLGCPLPVLKARKALRTMLVGQTLEILTNDPNAPESFRDFCQTANHELLQCARMEGNVYRLVIKNGGGQ